MQEKKRWRKAINLSVLILTIFLFVSPKCFAESYTIGIVGIDSRIKDKDINLGDYTDLTQLENPLAYAQNIFTNFWMSNNDMRSVGLVCVDKTERATSARVAEVNFQMDLGNPAEAIKLFDEKLDYLIYAYITNMTVTHRESLVSSNLLVKVNMTVRIVDAATGKIVCVATGKGESSSHGEAYRKSFKLGGEEISEDCWHEALEKALDQTAKKIKQRT